MASTVNPSNGLETEFTGFCPRPGKRGEVAVMRAIKTARVVGYPEPEATLGIKNQNNVRQIRRRGAIGGFHLSYPCLRLWTHARALASVCGTGH